MDPATELVMDPATESVLESARASGRSSCPRRRHSLDSVQERVTAAALARDPALPPL
jgi:hypothetical protein